MDDFYRSFARRAAQHLAGYRAAAKPSDQDDTVAWAERMRHLLNLAADDLGNLLNIVEALSGERFDRRP